MLISPRSFGDNLTEGIQMLGKVWKRLIPPTFATFVLLGAATIITFVLTRATDFLDLVLLNPEELTHYTDEQLFEPMYRFLLAAFIVLVFNGIAVAFLSIVVHRLVGAEVGGSPQTPGQASMVAALRLLPMLIAVLFGSIAIGIGLIAFVVPGVWLAISFSMVGPVIAVEGRSPIDALRRSFRLVRGRWWQTMGFLAMVGLMGSVGAELVQLIALPALSSDQVSLMTGLGFVFLVVVQGFITAAILVMVTVWYIDLRSRQETLLTSSLS